MAKFAALLEFTGNLDLVEATRPSHRAYLKSLFDDGKLVLSGPWEDGTGALIVYEAATLAEAESYLSGDPYRAAGVLTNARVWPWRVVMNAYEAAQVARPSRSANDEPAAHSSA